MVSSQPDIWTPDVKFCRGNSGMMECIQQETGVIGYLDSGLGWGAGMSEASLKNKYGRTLNSAQAAYFNGIGVKEHGIVPSDPTADFGSVSLLGT